MILWLEEALGKVSAKSMIGSFLGLSLGLITANMIVYSFFLESSLEPVLRDTLRVLLSVALGYLGATLGARKGEELQLGEEAKKIPGLKRYSENNYKILDTSVIIDGRIADICETGFIEGSLVIPQFVLKELQYIADSSDSVRRNRGRRGLEILHQIQKNADLDVQIIDQDFPKLKEVDTKLVALGKLLNGKILTNDFNLNKIAELQGVTVLNINQLANALKPVVLPGEIMSVFVLREGKEYGQGVGYLDDGTMVVIDNAKRHIGRTVEVAVTSVLQTTAGRMIFARLKEEIERGKAEHASSLWAFSKAKEEEGQGQ
ncbi:MAG: TRAM domain-containing protein [Candidatus Tectomicrobia bacterium]|uniref:TRAM domain-containing protein n=1 Tax=Tectimicrobiota bacterium TaxID=2528274 RepID=A0A932CM52_UNCTE|nr:TRAM domain-containing protein [Candidatus Tectomicrobia bacterium]